MDVIISFYTHKNERPILGWTIRALIPSGSSRKILGDYVQI